MTGVNARSRQGRELLYGVWLKLSRYHTKMSLCETVPHTVNNEQAQGNVLEISRICFSVYPLPFRSICLKN